MLAALESVDSDVDLGDPAQRRELRRQHSLVLAVVAAGGIIGSLIRYQLGLIWPTSAPEFPWTTLTINVTGAFVLGVLMVAISERWRGHPLARPFFGTGVLGGYTTFSAFAVDPAADPGGSLGIRRPVPGRDAGRCAAGRRRRDGAGTPDLGGASAGARSSYRIDAHSGEAIGASNREEHG